MAEAENRAPQANAAIRHRPGLAQHVVPFLMSLLFHAGIVVVGLLTYQSVKVLLHHETQTIPGDTPLISSPVNLGLNDGFRGDQNRPDLSSIQNELNDSSATGWNNRRGTDLQSLGRSFADERAHDASLDTPIGIGPRAGRTASSETAGDGGPLAPYGIPQRGGGTGIFGLGPSGASRPRSVAYLCDASGSMLPKFDALKRELAKAIQGLQPVQSFSVHFFSDTREFSLGPQLLMATPANKLHALNFLETIAPRGSTDPIPALERAFQQKPQLIFLLTDGDFPDNAAVLNRIRQLNRDSPVRINTIAFVGDGDSDTAFIALLEQIAHENSGTYRHVVQNELE